ncbi:hypothetical protein FZEAL_940 [Fusarium zealandicum]|uniref:ubiquitinyl hydrolase 1 n=1 Tax=Fusarium zealandicum TaxID=1053134 RepID=A0A8H4UUE4_9HYPO|nr:hypothetical protein FZEAL_940 [Fusarium zealandicum]
MSDRFRYTMHRARSVLIREITMNRNSCLDLAIKRRWPAFEANGNWHMAPSSFHWAESSSAGLQVHLNILTGELLVNGLPLSRLPREYEQHRDYTKVFGDMVLDVMPSTLPGMCFCTTKLFQGYVVHFAMQNEDLLVRLERYGKSVDLIPPRTLAALLPHSFVTEHVHWYHHDTKFIEFCPRGKPWTSNPDNWRLTQHGTTWKLSRRERTFLLAPSSSLAGHISGVLSPLETPLGLHMIYSADDDALEIRIPGLKLEFLMKSGEATIRSRQFRDMQIDSDQFVRTLVGLKSKLLLRSNQDPANRMLIIPVGTIQHHREQTFHALEDHVTVSVDHESVQRVQAYRIDNLLGRLVASTKVEGRLYLAYLHALTSYCIPDPFLGRTGTEEALEILNSASVRAPCRLTQEAYDILKLIALLSPERSFYPTHIRNMQVVGWSPKLSFLAQDDRFYKLVHEILVRSREVDFLYDKNDAVPCEPKHASMELVKRAILRSSGQQVSGFGAENFTTQYDVKYTSRMAGKEADRAVRAGEIVFRVYHNRHALPQPVNGDLASHLYELLESGETLSPGVSPPETRLGYDSMWLADPKTFLSTYWCQLHYAFHHDQKWLNKYELMTWMATMSYSNENDSQVTQALLMLALSQSVAAAPLPDGISHDLLKGYSVKEDVIETAANDASVWFHSSAEANLEPFLHESRRATENRRQQQYESQKRRAVIAFRAHLVSQWPCQAPSPTQEASVVTYIKVSQAVNSVLPNWQVWYENLQFLNYLKAFVSRLKEIYVEIVNVDPPYAQPAIEPRISLQGFVSIDNLFRQLPPSQTPAQPFKSDALLQKANRNEDTNGKMTDLLDSLDSKAKLDYEHRYLEELRHSLSSLWDHAGHEVDRSHISSHSALFQENLKRCEKRVKSIYNSLSDAVHRSLKSGPQTLTGISDGIDSILTDARFLPRISPVFFLQKLRRSQWSHLSDPWKDAIIDYGTAIAALQQAKRFIRFQNDHVDLLRELENSGHRGWAPRDHPEWLLLECESEIMIREVQQQIAQQMIEPPDDQNAVMQLNMGEGKSSVLVPIISTALGDGSSLVRVIVAKPQAKQMFQMLVSKLAGLLDRPVYQMPFSRDVRMDAQSARVIKSLTAKCMEEGGVLLVQPEHLLSFQLMELECCIDMKQEAAEKMAEIRNFFDLHSTDVVDESDENFNVKFELVYTIGNQRPIEHSPDRWTIIQEVLEMVRKLCAEARTEFPDSIDFDERHVGRFPKIRILRKDAEKVISDRVASFICETGMTSFPIGQQSQTVRNAVRRYITKPELSLDEIQAVEQSEFWADTTIGHIMLLRGLLSGGILAFAFGNKRWRVDYGTDPTRDKKTKLAVPFRAKDNPSPRSEFSHPDVVIVLTCLSYYYSGLENEALFDNFGLLVKSDNSDPEYETWVKTAPNLPDDFRHLQGVNLRDRIQCTDKVFPHIRFSKAAIDYYLSRMVFAKESKEFPHKLSASGWDMGKKKSKPTTGFSGTNDSRYVLPLDMKQLDLPEQKHTSALVLEYLLRPENSIALMPRDARAATFDSQLLLGMVADMSKSTRVILDVGAQVIDLTNLEFAQEWLKRYDEDENTQAVIFFNDLDEMNVVDRSGKIEDLQTSPFADQLDRCLVFLDEAHTRGTDLKLPTYYQAAVTLGANLTKDRLVQACMRMRKLGKGQTVVFCVPREIEQKIRAQQDQNRSPTESITVSDVLCWAITETCLDLRRAVPLWLTQGLRFYEQQGFWQEMSNIRAGGGDKSSWARKFLEDEGQSLDLRYRPHEAHTDFSSVFDKVESHVRNVFELRCHEFGLRELRTASLQEEQERELSPEAEQERQVEKPPTAKPATHQIHPGLRNFISTGLLKDGMGAFKPAFQSLAETTAAALFNVDDFPRNIWVTHDFATTVLKTSQAVNCSDSFQRPVQWILTSSREEESKCLVIVSPYEAQELLPKIEESNHLALHLYSPRVNVGFPTLDRLDLYSVPQSTSGTTLPQSLIIDLNLFAGQLYLSNFGEYVSLCDSLGLAWMPIPEGAATGPDGFIQPGPGTGNFVNKSAFTKSPVKFLNMLMAKIRQECGVIQKTHLGMILDGVRLQEDQFADE